MKLSEFLESNSLKLKDFSEKVGISVGYLCDLSNGKRRPSPDVAALIERATGGAVTRLELLYADQPDAQLIVRMTTESKTGLGPQPSIPVSSEE